MQRFLLFFLHFSGVIQEGLVHFENHAVENHRRQHDYMIFLAVIRFKLRMFTLKKKKQTFQVICDDMITMQNSNLHSTIKTYASENPTYHSTDNLHPKSGNLKVMQHIVVSNQV